MQTRQLGASGLTVSRLALGTMSWGRDTGADEAALALRAFRDAGGTLVDTADVYAGGDSERILGRLLGGDPGLRDGLVIATKAGVATPLGQGASRRHLLASLDASLRRLGVEAVDLWQLHKPDPRTPFEETLAAFDTAVASGKARYVGLSNHAGWQTAAMAAWQRAWPGRAPLVSAQVEWSLLARGVERELVPAADQFGMGVLAWSPLGRGVLTGKYRGGAMPSDSRGASDSWRRYVSPYLTEGSARVVDAVLTAADGLGVSPVALALAWIRDRPGVTAPIVGTRTAAQLRGALASEELTVPYEIAAALDDVSAPAFGYPERFPA
ncbi:MAG: aldo/keto reductase [Mycobacterium sp.]|jgi:aryl-alcohol dehydrogenase-like predicted oxidoreductase|nr:aldo/keto reductase [Mycobacterium sp.]